MIEQSANEIEILNLDSNSSFSSDKSIDVEKDKEIIKNEDYKNITNNIL